MNTTSIKSFRTDFAEAVKYLESKYGVKISLGNITYTTTDFTTKLIVQNGATNEDAEKIAFEKDVLYFTNYGLTKNDYNKEFIVQGKKYYLVGFKKRARKKPFVIKDVTGTKYVCTSETLKLKNNFASRFEVTIVE
jgi:hypothetical protein